MNERLTEVNSHSADFLHFQMLRTLPHQYRPANPDEVAEDLQSNNAELATLAPEVSHKDVCERFAQGALEADQLIQEGKYVSRLGRSATPHYIVGVEHLGLLVSRQDGPYSGTPSLYTFINAGNCCTVTLPEAALPCVQSGLYPGASVKESLAALGIIDEIPADDPVRRVIQEGLSADIQLQTAEQLNRMGAYFLAHDTARNWQNKIAPLSWNDALDMLAATTAVGTQHRAFTPVAHLEDPIEPGFSPRIFTALHDMVGPARQHLINHLPPTFGFSPDDPAAKAAYEYLDHEQTLLERRGDRVGVARLSLLQSRFYK